MKTFFLFLAFTILSMTGTHAKQTLPESPRHSAESCIYTIGKENLRKIYLKEFSASEEMLGEPIARYISGKGIPELKRGNYLIVNVVENHLQFRDYTIDDLNYKMVAGGKAMLCLYDSLGNILSDAVVRCGAKRLRFDPKTQTYNTSKLRDDQVLEVNHRGVYHYIEIEKSQDYKFRRNLFEDLWSLPRSLWYSVRRHSQYIFDPKVRPDKVRYTGFVVFSKPKYKPGETVNMKAYLANKNGKPYQKPVDLHLFTYYPDRMDTVLIRELSPYRPGMYEYQFKLTDSLKLKLDKTYRLGLNAVHSPTNFLDGKFTYEDYELKSIKMSMTTSKEEYVKGDTLKVKIKASDENGMAVYGGRAEICLIPVNIENRKKNASVFVPDTLWQQTFDMKDVSEKEITLPDSIFPGEASLRYQIQCTYLSADNEKHTQYSSLFRKADDYALDFILSKGILTIRQLHDGTSQKVEAEISMDNENDDTVLLDTVLLPYSMPVPWYATDVSVKTPNTDDFYSFDEVENDQQLKYAFYRQKDSLFLKVENPAQIPFWYSVRKNKNDLVSGFTKALDYSVATPGKDGFYMQLSYLFAGESKHIEQSLPYLEKNITLEVSTPTMVYPGQKTNVQVSVSDKKGRPVKDADVTAYAQTSKFGQNSMPNLPVKGKANFAKLQNNTEYTPDESGIYNQEGKMSWNKWKTQLALDTLEYYRFLYPETLYRYTEATPDGSTQIVPYVVLDGGLQGVQMLWIDNALYYTRLAQQMEVYTFPIEPGMHDLTLRTFDRVITVNNVLVEKGAKNILSFNAGKAYTELKADSTSAPFILSSRLLNKKERGILSEKEGNDLASQLITVDNHFGWLDMPNARTYDFPAYIRSGNSYYYMNHTKRGAYNYTLRTFVNDPVLVGPFPTRSYVNGLSDLASVYADNERIANIQIEGKNRYTLYKDFQKIKTWETQPFINKLSEFTPVADFRQDPLTPRQIDQLFDRMLKQNLITLNGSAIRTLESKDDTKKPDTRLELSIGKNPNVNTVAPSLIYFQSDLINDGSPCRLYYGGTRSFRSLPEGKVRISLVFGDSLTCSKELNLRPGGVNYLIMDTVERDSDKGMAKLAFDLLNRNIRKTKTQNPYRFDPSSKDSIISSQPFIKTYSSYNAEKGLVTGIVLDASGEPVIGAYVEVSGTGSKTNTGMDGTFVISAKPGDVLKIMYIGYEPKQIKASKGADFKIVLKESEMDLDETIVVGYGKSKKNNEQSVDLSDLEVPELMKRASITGSVQTISIKSITQLPLVIVDGLPFNGTIQDLDPATIASMHELNDASAVSIYGARAAGGVVFIQTKAFSNQGQRPDTGSEDPNAGNTLRRNFRDDAFWQPRLRTDEKGTATFEVTYPDDITSWEAYFIAVGNRKQTDKKQITVNSFKALSARLSTPSFAVRGDSLNVVGRITNLMRDSVRIVRTIKISGQTRADSLRISSSQVDQIPVRAEKGDSLTLAYSLHSESGIFDGEERTLPILEPGMLQTFGDFKVLNDTLTHPLKVDPLLGAVTLYAETSGLELFLREIDRVDKYPYLCNEQIASKIKVLLSKKRIMALLGKDFKDEKKMTGLIGKLEKNRNAEGLWGWWNTSPTESWISGQALSALLDAEEAGYQIDLDKKTLADKFEKEIRHALDLLNLSNQNALRFAKQGLLDRLILLKRLNPSMDGRTYFRSINDHLINRNTTDRLKTLQAMCVVGLQREVKLDSLMKDAEKTVLGSLYWGNEEMRTTRFSRPVLPYAGNMEQTLIAYRVLKTIVGHEAELENIRNYFFEMRESGSWQNTYESSRILETILPDVLKTGEDFRNARMLINGKPVTSFPYTETIGAVTPISVKNEGTIPLFVTSYQQTWNKKPVAETKKGFTVQSYFAANRNTLTRLTAGKSAQMVVLVNVEGEANYVQIEIPIPAGCSYEDKTAGLFRNEVHREHFKDKVVIFCNKLSKGEHTFVLNLLPRYTGNYQINPAKAELMYFPVFYGNEKLKTVDIQ